MDKDCIKDAKNEWEKDQIFKFILYCQRKADVPDLHSFFIETKNGKAFVSCGKHEVFVEEFRANSKNQFKGTAIAATNRLINLGAKYETIDM